MLRAKYLSAVGSGQINVSSGVLWTVNVTTAGGANSNLSLYDQSGSSDVGSTLIASIDLSLVGAYTFGVTCGRGLGYVLSIPSGNVAVTVGYV